MERTEKEYQELIAFMNKILYNADVSATKKVFYVQKLISSFEGVIDSNGDLTTPSRWFEISEKQKEFFKVIRASCNLKISYTGKVKMIKNLVLDF